MPARSAGPGRAKRGQEKSSSAARARKTGLRIAGPVCIYKTMEMVYAVYTMTTPLMTLRASKDLQERMTAAAREAGLSRSSWLLELARSALEGESVGKSPGQATDPWTAVEQLLQLFPTEATEEASERRKAFMFALSEQQVLRIYTLQERLQKACEAWKKYA